MASWNPLYQLVVNGESVDAGVTNRPTDVIINNLQYLKDIIDSLGTGAALLRRDADVESATAVGQPVYWNGPNNRYERALAGLTTNPMTGVLEPVASAHVVGIIFVKHSATKADILILGSAAVNLTAALNSVPLAASRYYLHASIPGVLTQTKPLLGVSVLIADGLGNVYVNPHLEDFFVGDHVHYSFNLTAYPAGTTAPPGFGGAHVIGAPSAALPGWLPAAHPSFGGLAPANAKFGYNLSQHPALTAVFPPVPTSAWSLVINKKDPFNTLGPPGTVLSAVPVIPIPPIPPGTSVDVIVPLPPVMPGDDIHVTPTAPLDPHLIWEAFSVVPGAFILRVMNVDVIPQVPPAIPWDTRVTTRLVGGQRTVPLDPVGLVQVDSNGIWWMSDCYGDAPWPTQLDTTAPFVPSPPGTCPRDEWPVELIFSFARLTFAANQNFVLSLQPRTNSPIVVEDVGAAPATVGHLYLDLKMPWEVDARILEPFTTVVETIIGGLHYWRFPVSVISSMKLQIEVPVNFLVPTPKVRLRLKVLGTTTGTLPNLLLSYRILPRPGGVGVPVSPPGVDTPLPLTTAYAITANQYTEALSDPIAVTAGATIIFTLARAAADGYAGDVGLVRGTGIMSSI